MRASDDNADELERRGHARVAEGHALLAKAAELRARRGSEEWLPASSSPIGKRRTLALARKGVIESAKIGRKVFVRESSLRALIEASRRAVGGDVDEEDLFDANAPCSSDAAPARAREQSTRRRRTHISERAERSNGGELGSATKEPSDEVHSHTE